MNTGTTGSQPLFSLINLGVYNRYKSQDPRDWLANLERDFPALFSTLTERQNAVAARYGGNLFTVPSTRYNSRTWPPTAIQGRGETNTPALFAMTDSAGFFGYVGLDLIYARGVALADYMKQKIEAHWGPEALWVGRGLDPSFATFLTAFNPFEGKNDGTQMTSAMSAVLSRLASEDPKIYIRTITWRSRAGLTADDRIGFRVSTHAMYNNYEQIDWMFDRLVAAVDATGYPQVA